MSSISTKLILSAAVCLSLSACSTGKGSEASSSRYVHTPFSTSFIDRASVVKMGSVVVLAPELTTEAQDCRERFDISKKIDQVFKTESRINLLSDGTGERSASEVISAISSTGADGAMGLRLVRCSDRIGSSFGATEPAQVGFLINLYDRSGRIVWTGTFSMKDQAIFDNLLTAGEKLKVGTGWVTASQLFEHGLTLAAREFENQRTGLYLNGVR